jgi:hypothetical protein
MGLFGIWDVITLFFRESKHLAFQSTEVEYIKHIKQWWILSSK